MKYSSLWIIVLFFLAVSCYDDKGNYNYHEINNVEITGIETGAWYNKIAFVDTLRLTPEIHSSWFQENLDNYKFEWKMIPSNADKDKVGDTLSYVISREKDLILPIIQDAGDYNCYFVVRDTVNGLDWRQPFNLRVKSLTSEGWMVLCDEGGEGRLDIVFDESENNQMIAHDLWRDDNFTTGKPLQLIYNYSLRGAAVLYICEKGTYNLSRKDLHVGEDNDLKWSFGVPPARVDVRGTGTSQFGNEMNYWVIVTQEGDCYFINKDEVGSIFTFPTNRIGGQEYFKAAPFVGISYSGEWGTPILMYDATNRQFLEIVDGASYPSVMKFSGDQLFRAQTGQDMVHLESTKSGFIYAVLKNPADEQYYFYCIEMAGSGKNYQRYYGKILGDDLSDVKRFACHHMKTKPYLFYATEHKVYQFDMAHPDKKAKEVLYLPNEHIQVLKFTPFVAWEQYQPWERERNYQLLLGTNVQGENGELNGVMRMYEVPELMGDLEKVREHTGFGKIVDITYKERTKN